MEAKGFLFLHVYSIIVFIYLFASSLHNLSNFVIVILYFIYLFILYYLFIYIVSWDCRWKIAFVLFTKLINTI